MARMRMVRPELFTHDGLFEAESKSGLPLRLAFIGLWTQCDREGRFKWRPLTLKLAIVPWDTCDFGRVLDTLADAGFVERYEVDGQVYGCIPTWGKHQHPHFKEAPSALPEPPSMAKNHTEGTGEGSCKDEKVSASPLQAPGKPQANPRRATEKASASPSESESESESAKTDKSNDLSINSLSEEWVFYSTAHANRKKRDVIEGIIPQIAELARAGVPRELILAEIRRKDRNRNEWFDAFDKRMRKAKPAGVSEEDAERIAEETRVMMNGGAV